MATVVQQEPAAAVEEFIGRGVTDIAGAMTTIFCIVGDRLGLFQALDEGPANATELAGRAGIDERYALEWLRGLASAGYLAEDESGRYTLPPAHAVVLAREGNPMFVGGAFHELGGMLPALERIIEAFRAGGRVAGIEYSSLQLVRKWVQRNIALAVACGVALVLLLGAGVRIWLENRQARRYLAQALLEKETLNREEIEALFGDVPVESRSTLEVGVVAAASLGGQVVPLGD